MAADLHCSKKGGGEKRTSRSRNRGCLEADGVVVV